MRRLVALAALLPLALPAPARAAAGLWLSPTVVTAAGLRPGRTYAGPPIVLANPSSTPVEVTAQAVGRGPYLRLGAYRFTLLPGGRQLLAWRLVVPALRPGRYTVRVTFTARGGGQSVREATMFRLEVT